MLGLSGNAIIGMAPGARSFVQFTLEHYAALFAITATAAALIVLARAAAPSRRRHVHGWLAGAVGFFLLFAVAAEPPYEIATGVWDVKETLPLHLCDLAEIVSIVLLVAAARDPRPPQLLEAGVRKVVVARVDRPIAQQAYELTYYWGLAGTLQALLTPALAEGFPHPLYFEYFVAHGGIVVGGLLLTLGCGWRPRPGSQWRALLITYALAFPVGLIDWLLGANYMYLCGPPPQASIYDYFGRWPWSLVTLAVVGVGLMWICYLPFAWLDAARQRSRAHA